ncbi:fatty acid desaturase [Flavitalea sp. BT771]|uniref:fatty acid desaturase n=1 Tax=Flavitalea sp. BT771 TaxID=3063329 RepID=UPI0026E41855|nr:fatty acid desaturase [Flavitalea sp. BT771]MDO6428982.1 fatty acid desaturase [Flavitalea sp. BT771]MDV6218890.1 fatty acid desaturase [Flavitalea sp. BT771]
MHQYHTSADPGCMHAKKANLMDYVLQVPSYGWCDLEGRLVIPTSRQILKECWFRLNIFRTKKNWLGFFNWIKVLLLIPCLFIFLLQYFNFHLLGIAFIYSMVVMGTHGTIWYHRYCTHGAYTFRNKFWRFITRNMTINMIPEEIYVISHHVHHAKSDQPGDPYNAGAGFLYCFLADVNHQTISGFLTEDEYARVVRMMGHSGVRPNTYRQYQKWGSVARPGWSLGGWILNWAFWGVAFYLLGGAPLVFALFGAAGFWAIGVRTFNYEGHGKGKDKHKEGVDFNKDDLSINQLWPGYVAGEWHNNHHLFPSSARSGFLNYQLDLAWYYIKFLKIIGAVSSYHDSKKLFLSQYLQPYMKKKKP